MARDLYENVYTMPFAGMKQIVRRSLTSITKRTFLYIEIRPQVSNDPDYVLYEIWNKKKDFRLGDVDVAKLSEQQTDVALQIDPTLDSEERKFLDVFIELFFDKVDDLRKGLEYLKTAQGESKQMVQVKESERFSHDRAKRRVIVAAYHEAHARGDAPNKENWAQMKHGISGKTLSRYIQEVEQDTKDMK